MPSSSHAPSERDRADRCPGVFRPWPAEDGGLVRVRLVGGRITPAQLLSLSAFAGEHGDGDLHLTNRANLQVRGLPLADDLLPTPVADALVGTGLVPAPEHDLVRNVLVSPLTGLAGGRADLRPVAAELDRLLCASPRLAALPGRFLFVLDDGRGDLAEHTADLGLVTLDEESAQLRIGSTGWGDVVSLDDAAARLVSMALAFLDHRGTGPSAPWHVDELVGRWLPLCDRDPRTQVRTAPLPYGVLTGGEHVGAPQGVISPDLAADLAARGDAALVVTPWRGVLVPEVAA